MKHRCSFLCLIFGLLCSPLVFGETRYVTDRLLVDLRTEPGNRGKSVATLPSGTPLEVLQLSNDFARVTAPGEREGWVAERYLTDEEPAMSLLLRLRDEQRHTQAELERLREQKFQPPGRAPLVFTGVIGVIALVVGFVLGVLWLDHKIRVRHGGFRV